MGDFSDPLSIDAHLRDLVRELHCPLCGNFFERTVSLSCSHRFCSSCIEESLCENSVCPSCELPAWNKDVKRNPMTDSVVHAVRKFFGVLNSRGLATSAFTSNVEGSKTNQIPHEDEGVLANPMDTSGAEEEKGSTAEQRERESSPPRAATGPSTMASGSPRSSPRAKRRVDQRSQETKPESSTSAASRSAHTEADSANAETETLLLERLREIQRDLLCIDDFLRERAAKRSRTRETPSPVEDKPPRDQSLDEDDLAPSRNQFPIVVTTGLGEEDQRAVAAAVRQLGGCFTRQQTARVTHVISALDDDTFAKRTLKYFYGLCRRQWIVSMDWVRAGAKVGFWPQEEMFELPGDSRSAAAGHRNGPKRARTQKKKLFQSAIFLQCGKFRDGMPIQDLVSLINECGGNVVDSIPALEVAREESTGDEQVSVYVLTDLFSGENGRSRVTRDVRRREGIRLLLRKHPSTTVVTPAWVCDAISAYTTSI